MTKKDVTVQDVQKVTEKQLHEFQLLKALKERFDTVWVKAEENIKFIDYCYELGISRQHQMYLVAGLIDGGGLQQTEKCKVIGIPFNRKQHRRFHDDHRNPEITLFAKKCLDLHVRKEKRSLSDVLEAIIHGEARATDKVKAIESLVKLQEKTEGNQALKPWQRIWLETIIPSIQSNYIEANSLDQ